MPCPNCNTEMLGRYCHQCGQKKFDRHDLTAKHFFEHTLHEVTHLDANKIVKTFSTLLFHPGKLSAEYLAGRVAAFLTPVRLYLTVSALFFLFAWTTLSSAGGGGMERFMTQPRFQAWAEQQGIAPESLAEQIGHKREQVAAALRFVGVLFSGAFLALLYRRAQRYYAEHLIFSLHFYSFDFLLRCAFALLLLGFGQLGFNMMISRFLFYPLVFGYLFWGLLKIYRESLSKTFLKTAVLLLGETALYYATVFLAHFIAMRMA